MCIKREIEDIKKTNGTSTNQNYGIEITSKVNEINSKLDSKKRLVNLKIYW